MMLVKEIENKKWRWKTSMTLTEKEIKEKVVNIEKFPIIQNELMNLQKSLHKG